MIIYGDLHCASDGKMRFITLLDRSKQQAILENG